MCKRGAPSCSNTRSNQVVDLTASDPHIRIRFWRHRWQRDEGASVTAEDGLGRQGKTMATLYDMHKRPPPPHPSCLIHLPLSSCIPGRRRRLLSTSGRHLQPKSVGGQLGCTGTRCFPMSRMLLRTSRLCSHSMTRRKVRNTVSRNKPRALGNRMHRWCRLHLLPDSHRHLHVCILESSTSDACTGFKMAGFLWDQGWNDGCSEEWVQTSYVIPPTVQSTIPVWNINDRS